MTKSAKRLAAAASAAVHFIIVLLAIFAERYSDACTKGLGIWLNFVVPTLFPFFVLTAILTKLGAVSKASAFLTPLTRSAFRLPGISSYCFVMSILSGYPVGSRIIADLYENGLIDNKQASRMSALCSTSGPMFVIGSVGSAMFQSKAAGLILFASHLFAVIAVSMIAARFYKKEEKAPPKTATLRADNVLYESVYGAVISILCVGGFITVFYVLIEMLTDFRILWPLSMGLGKVFSLFGMENAAGAFTEGLLEVTRGAKALSAFGPSTLPLAAFLVTFGGACILAQQLGYLKKAGVKGGRFVGMKLIQAVAAALVCLLLCKIFL